MDGGLKSKWMSNRIIKLSDLARFSGTNFVGKDMVIRGLGLCNRNSEYHPILSYTSSSDFLEKAVSNSAVQALVVTSEIYNLAPKERFSFVLTPFPEEVFYSIHRILCDETDFYECPTEAPLIGKNCHIHPTAILEDNVSIGNGVSIGAYTLIRRNSVIGDHCVIGNNTVIGSEGFQILRGCDGVPYRVKHVGGTVIGRYVHIGDQVTIANALFEGAVLVGDHTMIDNFCYIAHNCVIGRNCVLTASVRLMGSVVLEDYVYVAPQAVVLNKITIGEEAFVGTSALVNKDVPAHRIVMGIPAELKEDYMSQRNVIKSLQRERKPGVEYGV